MRGARNQGDLEIETREEFAARRALVHERVRAFHDLGMQAVAALASRGEHDIEDWDPYDYFQRARIFNAVGFAEWMSRDQLEEILERPAVNGFILTCDHVKWLLLVAKPARTKLLETVLTFGLTVMQLLKEIRKHFADEALRKSQLNTSGAPAPKARGRRAVIRRLAGDNTGA
jgi:hypothetical protein